MIGQEGREVEREKIAMLRVLGNSQGPVGSKIIARRLREEYGIGLLERAVRYHLRLLDERGLTRKISRRDGRAITQLGLEELRAVMSDNPVLIDVTGAYDKAQVEHRGFYYKSL